MHAWEFPAEKLESDFLDVKFTHFLLISAIIYMHFQFFKCKKPLEM